MPLIPCPDCRREISDAAPACIHCGRPAEPLALTPVDAPVREVEPRPGLWERMSDRAKASVVIGSLALIGMCALGSSGSGGGSAAASTGPAAAFADCSIFAERQLKAPGTATFATFSPDRVAELEPGRFLVMGWADAENSFGAKLRREYACTVRYGDGRAVLEDLTWL